MPKYICPAEYTYIETGVPIAQAIRNERMRLDDIEWDTGVRPVGNWLKFLIGEQQRGKAIFATGTKRVKNPEYEKWMAEHG
jgi:hypothetical protein